MSRCSLSPSFHPAWLPRGVAAPAISNLSKIRHRHYGVWEHLEIIGFVLPMAGYFDFSSFLF
jgi:hypothetical protein